ncbi:CPBP family intramembrane glutamic endopeptidase [uncultured Thermosynechococcus sp.]|uniref:CPBP family intramembrane glutamic endopeptidase n=2 Tax=uncultured Thermosynechococcus sp. TaxID=436945 RepID=UPI0026365C35|nr:CPBP family intramembrane glutamic endopeptidase [uncultured Thermosynechococcus sp.]
MAESPLPDEPLSRTQVLVAMALTAVLWLILARVWLFTPFSGGLLPLRWDGWAVVVGIGLCLGITGMGAILYRLWPAYRHASDTYLKLVLSPLLWPDLFWIGILPGLSEELLFRGVLLPSLGLNWAGIIGSSVCFGILHAGSRQQWPYALWATIVGGLFAYSVVATHNLLLAIVAHTCTNWLAATLWKVAFWHSSPHQS